MSRAKTVQRGYGAAHKKLRARWKPLVDAGQVMCARCGKVIQPGLMWDLGHDDHDRSRYGGPEHARCNRGAPGRKRRAKPVGIPVDDPPVDDPEHGVFWGPRTLGGQPIRWSRAWY